MSVCDDHAIDADDDDDGQLRGTLGHLGTTLGHLAVALGHSGVNLGHSGVTWGHLGLTLGHFEHTLCHLGVHLWVTLSNLGATLKPVAHFRPLCNWNATFCCIILSGGMDQRLVCGTK